MYQRETWGEVVRKNSHDMKGKKTGDKKEE